MSRVARLVWISRLRSPGSRSTSPRFPSPVRVILEHGRRLPRAKCHRLRDRGGIVGGLTRFAGTRSSLISAAPSQSS